MRPIIVRFHAMNTDWLTSFRDAGSTVYVAIDAASPWTLLFVGLSLPFVAWIILSIYRNIARNVGAVYRTFVYRLSESVAGWKTWFIVKYRHLLPRRRSRNVEATPQIEFDDLDIAVMKIAATLGPGFAVNAAELADRFSLRPSQIQRSLDKLSNNKMLDNVIGSNEGFDNYRLTQLGNAFMATWAKRTSRA